MTSGMKSDDRPISAVTKPCLATIWLTVSLILITLTCVPADAQAQGVKQAVLLQPAAPGELLTVELTDARRKEIADSTDLSDDVKKKADDHLKVAADSLKRISDLAASAAQFKSRPGAHSG
jgi:hypothetical protein